MEQVFDTRNVRSADKFMCPRRPKTVSRHHRHHGSCRCCHCHCCRIFLQLIAQLVDLLSLLPLRSGDIKIALPNGNSLLPRSWYRGPDQRDCRHYRHRRHHGNWRYCRAGLWHKQILYKLENLSHEDSHLPSNGVEQTHRFTALRCCGWRGCCCKCCCGCWS